MPPVAPASRTSACAAPGIEEAGQGPTDPGTSKGFNVDSLNRAGSVTAAAPGPAAPAAPGPAAPGGAQFSHKLSK